MNSTIDEHAAAVLRGIHSASPGAIAVVAIVDPLTGEVAVQSQNLPQAHSMTVARSLYEHCASTTN
jgi:hypothetical protein